MDTEDTPHLSADIPRAEIEGATSENTEEPEVHDEREIVQQEGWLDLVVSFIASGVMTVGVPGSLSQMRTHHIIALCLLLPDRFCCTLVWEIPRA